MVRVVPRDPIPLPRRLLLSGKGYCACTAYNPIRVRVKIGRSFKIYLYTHFSRKKQKLSMQSIFCEIKFRCTSLGVKLTLPLISTGVSIKLENVSVTIYIQVTLYNQLAIKFNPIMLDPKRVNQLKPSSSRLFKIGKTTP